MRFEWDAEKAANNLRKHGVSFVLARRAFYDPWAVIEQDRIENGEYRWQCLGLVMGVLLEEHGVEIIRINIGSEGGAKRKEEV